VPYGVELEGRPRILISHGRKDQILPFENTSGEMVPLLKQAGYDVTFLPFDGPHVMPPNVAREAMEWFLK
jgi:phospholipase/carboxylesterase